MGIGASVFLIAAGAILTYATNLEVSGIDLDVVGIILIIAGSLGMLAALAISRGGSGSTVVREHRRYD
ncbi:MAG: DUF6458 family protein [Carbonactinosporaceae bacterium]